MKKFMFILLLVGVMSCSVFGDVGVTIGTGVSENTLDTGFVLLPEKGIGIGGMLSLTAFRSEGYFNSEQTIRSYSGGSVYGILKIVDDLYITAGVGVYHIEKEEHTPLTETEYISTRETSGEAFYPVGMILRKDDCFVYGGYRLNNFEDYNGGYLGFGIVF